MSRSALRMRLCSSFPKLTVLGACALLALGAASIALAGASHHDHERGGQPDSRHDPRLSRGCA